MGRVEGVRKFRKGILTKRYGIGEIIPCLKIIVLTLNLEFWNRGNGKLKFYTSKVLVDNCYK